MQLVISIASILLAAAPALAATITLRPQTPDRPNVVMVEGLLVADDGDQFGAKTASLPSAFVAFSSDGGSLVAGLRIGEAIRRKGFSTITEVLAGRRYLGFLLLHSSSASRFTAEPPDATHRERPHSGDPRQASHC